MSIGVDETRGIKGRGSSRAGAGGQICRCFLFTYFIIISIHYFLERAEDGDYRKTVDRRQMTVEGQRQKALDREKAEF